MLFSEFDPATSPPYVAGVPWFSANEGIRFRERFYIGENDPYVVSAPELLYPVGSFQGFPLFADTGDTVPEYIYMAVRPGCVFAPWRATRLRPVS